MAGQPDLPPLPNVPSTREIRVPTFHGSPPSRYNFQYMESAAETPTFKLRFNKKHIDLHQPTAASFVTFFLGDVAR